MPNQHTTQISSAQDSNEYGGSNMLKSQTVMASSTENILVKDSNLAGLALEN